MKKIVCRYHNNDHINGKRSTFSMKKSLNFKVGNRLDVLRKITKILTTDSFSCLLFRIHADSNSFSLYDRPNAPDMVHLVKLEFKISFSKKN